MAYYNDLFTQEKGGSTTAVAPTSLKADRLGVTVEKLEGNGSLGLSDVMLRPDGKLWYKSSSYGSSCIVPLTDDLIVRAFGGDTNTLVGDITGVLEEGPKKEWLLPHKVLRKWRKYMLAAFDTESVCIYGKRRIRAGHNVQSEKRRPIWLAVFPKQEVTGSTTDVDDFGPAGEALSSLGYKRVGTIHTHPGTMTGCSLVDEKEMWEEFGGIHYILPRMGGTGVYYSSGGFTWCIPYAEIKGEKNQDKKQRGIKGKGKNNSTPPPGVPYNMLGEDKTKDIPKLVTHPAPIQVQRTLYAPFTEAERAKWEKGADRNYLGQFSKHTDYPYGYPFRVEYPLLDEQPDEVSKPYSGYSTDQALFYPGGDPKYWEREHQKYIQEAVRQKSNPRWFHPDTITPQKRVPKGALCKVIAEKGDWILYDELVYKALGSQLGYSVMQATAMMVKAMEAIGLRIVNTLKVVEDGGSIPADEIFDPTKGGEKKRDTVLDPKLATSLFYGFEYGIELLAETSIEEEIEAWFESLGLAHSLDLLLEEDGKR